MRGEIVPYIRLREYFHVARRAPESEQIMVVETEEGRCGFVVDQVLGDCQTVIKNLGRFYRHVQVVSGATILGNGTVALILDPERLVQEAMRAKLQRDRGRLPAGGTRCRERPWHGAAGNEWQRSVLERRPAPVDNARSAQRKG